MGLRPQKHLTILVLHGAEASLFVLCQRIVGTVGAAEHGVR